MIAFDHKNFQFETKHETRYSRIKDIRRNHQKFNLREIMTESHTNKTHRIDRK